MNEGATHCTCTWGDAANPQNQLLNPRNPAPHPDPLRLQPRSSSSKCKTPSGSRKGAFYKVISTLGSGWRCFAPPAPPGLGQHPQFVPRAPGASHNGNHPIPSHPREKNWNHFEVRNPLVPYKPLPPSTGAFHSQENNNSDPRREGAKPGSPGPKHSPLPPLFQP